MLKTKNALIECFWLLGCVIFAILAGLAFFGKAVFEKDIDINLHDTYFVIKDQHILIWCFILFSFILYFIKEKRQGFRRKLPYFIFLVLGLAVSILLMRASPMVSFFNPWQSGWTVYPPLSVKIKADTINPIKAFATDFLTPFNGLLLLQVLVITALLLATYRYTKNSNK
ncbi:Cytochrome C and Quinol oxidase polypeptide I [compost metagenome]